MLDRLLRAAYRRLHPTARNNLRTWLALEQRDCEPPSIANYAVRSVLVLAPHSDDEVIGCGGTMARHVQSGAQVHVAFLTDGRWGDGALFSPQLSATERHTRQLALVATRKDEARAAAAVLGVQHLHFLDLPDGALQVNAHAVQLLTDVLHSSQPSVVYLPFVFDLHQDHWQTNRLFAAAAARLPASLAKPLLVRGYEVWSPLVANCFSDITSVMSLKRSALSQFASQLRDQNYLRIVEGLNAYRSNGALHGMGYAEAFHEAPLAAYQRLVQAAELKSQRLRLPTP